MSHQTQTGAELTKAAEHAVDPSLKLTEHAVVIQRTPITRGNLRRLLNNQKPKDMYLDDEIINFYFARLMDRAERHPTLPKIHCYLTQFFESTKRENWASKVTVFDKDIVLIPILIKAIDHWVLVAFFPLIKTVIYYDSLHKDGTSIRKQVLQFFKTRFPKETGSASDDSEWKSVDEPHVPKQENGFDCGVFVCQMAERLSRRSEFDFDQSQMPAIRIQMIEQIVAGKIPLPPSDQVPTDPIHPSRFDKPQSKQISCLETELRDLRAKFAAQEIELKEVKSKAENQLNETIQTIQKQANDEIQRLRTELAEANRNLEVMAAVSERMQNTKNERIAKMETEHRQQINNLKQDAEKYLNERLNALQADHEEEIQKLMADLKEANSKHSAPIVTETETQTTLDDVEAQTEERPDSPQPMLDEFPHDSEGTSTRPKTPQSESNSSSDSSNDSDSDYDQPSTKKRRLSASLNIEPLPETDEQDLPVCPSAQIPPPLPEPIKFGDGVVVPGRVKNGDKNVSIFRPNQVVNLPMVQEPDPNFPRWLHTHGIPDDFAQLPAVTRDLELRRRFLVNGDLTQAEKQFIVDRVPPVYESNSMYLRALAGLALSQYDHEQAFALLFCFSRISTKAIKNLFQRL